MVFLGDLLAGLFDIPNTKIQALAYSSEFLPGILHVMILSRLVPVRPGDMVTRGTGSNYSGRRGTEARMLRQFCSVFRTTEIVRRLLGFKIGVSVSRHAQHTEIRLAFSVKSTYRHVMALSRKRPL